MDVLFAAAVLVGAAAATYFFCVRPMRRGQCAATPQGTGREMELRRLREEVHRLKREISEG